MDIIQQKIAHDLISYLEGFPFINSCVIHGSLAKGTGDKYSDIDLQIDVSGHDNGKVLLMLPYLIDQKFPLVYVAFAPRFAPDLYVVSFAIKGANEFHFVDIECIASPHISSLSKDEIRALTDFTSLKTKLLIGCLKKELRGEEYLDEIKFLTRSESNDALGILKEAFDNNIKETTGHIRDISKKCLEHIL